MILTICIGCAIAAIVLYACIVTGAEAEIREKKMFEEYLRKKQKEERENLKK